MRFRTLSLTATALAAALVLAGCSQNSDMSGNMPGMDHSSSSAAPSAAAGEVNGTDQMFVMMMIPHHQQAIEMSDLVLAKEGVDPRVADLAQRIKDAQGPEIETMKGWLQDWGMPWDDSMVDSMAGMDSGMMSADDMAALETADGATASRLFLEQMILHHEGAIEMAQNEIDGGADADVIALAQAVVDGQTAEITEMKDILATLP